MSRSYMEDRSSIVKADEKFFKAYVEKNSGLVIPAKETKAPLRDDRDKKQYCFFKKQFKMRNKENLEERTTTHINLVEERLKIKQESQFIFLTNQKPVTSILDNYVKKDEHGVAVPLSGIKLFVEIILQNRVVLGLNKLFDKHEQVKKKRESEIKLKKKNEEKERLRMMYKLE
jgi:hypothetical protein